MVAWQWAQGLTSIFGILQNWRGLVAAGLRKLRTAVKVTFWGSPFIFLFALFCLVGLGQIQR